MHSCVKTSSAVAATAAHSTTRSVAGPAALLVIVIAGTLLRAWNIHAPVLFRDEAESAVNALTILQHGYPADEYLGLPMYENTLLRPWPQSDEYEFRDVSYSDRGMAIYHGWLPLYAKAGSMALLGVRPDEATSPPQARQGWNQQMHRRTAAARLPSVMFGAVFIIASYYAGAMLYGRDAGFTAAVAAALAEPTVRVARQARYYSLTLLLSTLCIGLLWMVLRCGRWRDFVAAAIVLVLLFHTHALTFLVACIVGACLLPWMVRHPMGWPKSLAAGAIVTAGVAPWIILTGFLDHLGEVPRASELMAFPADWLAFFQRHHKPTLLLVLALAAVGPAVLLRRKLPPRIALPLLHGSAPIAFLAIWLMVGVVVFMALIPAPSAFLWRLTISLQGPGLVLAGILVAAGARMILPRRSELGAVAVAAVLLILAAPRLRVLSAMDVPEREPIVEMIAYLDQQRLRPDTRIYALPYQHFAIQYYSGLPVQSVAPVRRSFLDNWPGPLIILEPIARAEPIGWRKVQAAADSAGVELDGHEARAWQRRLMTRLLREELATRGASPQPPLVELPDWAEALRDEVRAAARAREAQVDPMWDNPAMFRGYEARNWEEFWPIFFYRFVEPTQRMGSHLNYAGRIKGATAVVLESSWTVIHCPPRGSADPSPPEAVEAP